MGQHVQGIANDLCDGAVMGEYDYTFVEAKKLGGFRTRYGAKEVDPIRTVRLRSN